MFRWETFLVACDALRANKLRAFLTMLGVVIGSACLVLVVTVALTGRRYVTGQIESVGSNLVWAEYLSTPQQARALSNEITLGDLEAVKAGIPQVGEVAGTRDIPMAVAVDGQERPISLVGVTEGFQTIRHLVILRGRFFDTDDMQSRSKVCLVTKDLADRIFPYEDPVGKSLRAGELRFTVVGVFRERVATFGLSEIQRESAIIPFPLMKYYTGTEILQVLYAQARRPDDVPSVTRQVERVLKSRHSPGAVYNVQNLSSILDAARSISHALTVVLLVIASIALLISGVGIMNIMLVTVTERTREIGIRKAVGAPHSDILYQFLIEAFLISGMGAVVGVLIGVSIPVLIQPLLPGNLRVPISGLSVGVAFLVTCSTGIFFGYLPASKAAKLPPTESLRYE
ncbi:MAG TPA: ABC transporter permease [Candidatus Acidoferrales bacterium]|nr:ABC transporter permease [Candidatus Acidoferrales bacterium]